MIERFIKINFIQGLLEIVSGEIAQNPNISVQSIFPDCIYLNKDSDVHSVLQLKTITNAYLVKRGKNLNPAYLSNHKSVLMELVDEVLLLNKNKIKSFKLSCAGDESEEVTSIKQYIKEYYKLTEDPDDADLKIYIGKNKNVWELGVEMTARPLSSRDYKIGHIKGGINPTVAYAINSLCDLKHHHSYLNVFSGSATLLIEAALVQPDIRYIGFDNNKDHISTAIQNLTRAKLLTSIQIKFLDIFDNPYLGTFEVIVSDLPFGMHIGKGDDLEKLYRTFIYFCEKTLDPSGTLAIYTTESDLLESILQDSKFEAITTIELKIVTNVNSYIYPKIFIFKFK